MSTYALAIDLGASSGRHMLGHVENGRIELTEVYRFPNAPVLRNGHLCWDADALYAQVLTGLSKCAALGAHPATLGIDTWGVDYVLLDAVGERIGDAVAYRDSRTEAMPARLDQAISPQALYARTGIARQSYNTVYQLMADFSEHPERLATADGLLFTPCYLNYRLTGRARNEYTIASTSGLLNAQTRRWDSDTLCAAGIPATLLRDQPLPPGTRLGALLPSVAQSVGFSCDVILPPCHDTGCAYLAVPACGKGSAFLSSGTWSLLGTELDAPVLSDAAREAGFTNEGGYGGKIRFLRNIMGLWILQSIRKEWDDRYTFAEMAAIAARGSAYAAVFDVTDERFLAPESMVAEIRHALRDNGAPDPDGEEALLFSVHNSLAAGYARAVANLSALSGQTFTSLNVVGGGCQNRLINQLTANATGLPVCAGPVEGTALGNLLAQWIATGEIAGVEEARALLRRSVTLEEYLPQ